MKRVHCHVPAQHWSESCPVVYWAHHWRITVNLASRSDLNATAEVTGKLFNVSTRWMSKWKCSVVKANTHHRCNVELG